MYTEKIKLHTNEKATLWLRNVNHGNSIAFSCKNLYCGPRVKLSLHVMRFLSDQVCKDSIVFEFLFDRSGAPLAPILYVVVADPFVFRQ